MTHTERINAALDAEEVCEKCAGSGQTTVIDLPVDCWPCSGTGKLATPMTRALREAARQLGDLDGGVMDEILAAIANELDPPK